MGGQVGGQTREEGNLGGVFPKGGACGSSLVLREPEMGSTGNIKEIMPYVMKD